MSPPLDKYIHINILVEIEQVADASQEIAYIIGFVSQFLGYKYRINNERSSGAVTATMDGCGKRNATLVRATSIVNIRCH